jgi:hypothetical protein
MVVQGPVHLIIHRQRALRQQQRQRLAVGVRVLLHLQRQRGEVLPQGCSRKSDLHACSSPLSRGSRWPGALLSNTRENYTSL